MSLFLFEPLFSKRPPHIWECLSLKKSETKEKDNVENDFIFLDVPSSKEEVYFEPIIAKTTPEL